MYVYYFLFFWGGGNSSSIADCVLLGWISTETVFTGGEEMGCCEMWGGGVWFAGCGLQAFASRREIWGSRFLEVQFLAT